MKNFIQEGNVLTLTAPTGGVVSGQGYLIGALFVVALVTALESEPFTAVTKGVIKLPVTAANTPAAGGLAYWNNTAREVTTTASGNTLIGHFVSVKDAANQVEVLIR